MAGVRFIGKMDPGFQGAQMNWIDNAGVMLESNNSLYGFGFATTTLDVTKFLLVVVHMKTTRAIWTANRGSPISNSDRFIFSKDGRVSLQKDGSGVVVWSPETGGNGNPVSSIQLLDSGNLVLVGKDGRLIWESFVHPTDTLITGQDFSQGMKLVSDPASSTNLTYILEIKSGDLIISAGFETPQQYWSMQTDNRKTINSNGGGGVSVAAIEGNSWKLYNSRKVLLSQFIFSDSSSANGTWIVVMGSDGFVSFYNLDSGGGDIAAAPTKIPDDPCSRPESCGAYLVCSSNNVCQCPSPLSSQPNCNPGVANSCSKGSASSTALVDAGNQLNYFALRFAKPTSSKTDLESCKSSCSRNCSCLALFFQISSGNCFHFADLGSFTSSTSDSGSGFSAFIKVLKKNGNGGTGSISSSSNRFPFGAIIAIAVATVAIIVGILFIAFRYYRRKRNKLSQSLADHSSEDDTFLENLSGMPIRFSYKELQNATNNFSVKLGQGGFGSVYKGLLPDGSRLAVKKLEGIGQGKKEFRAEVSIIGSTHHHHLVRLKGFCAEGSHRMLAYEFMANGSLEQWIFKGKNEEFLLDWNTRFNIALGTAKGLAYLHQDCDVKIIHCDIKPENVLLDDNFLAKVSDFGLAKLMTREQSHVFTTMRGTRGYLAPEWITNYAISEKSDVYSYGMLLLEIISGRKNFVQTESSEKSHFPSYAFKMMEEGKLREILDSKLKLDEEDERVGTAVKVALWCIQEDMSVRPSMTKVVQMLEGIYAVPKPPTSSPLTARLYSGIFKSISEEGASSGKSDCNSDVYQSAVRLSGPR
ncbi:G-type lectin S-receptor-like serine/threonine-protein kinase SD2-5 [Linum perenne]